MKSPVVRFAVCLCCAAALFVAQGDNLRSAEITAAQAAEAIGRAKRFLLQAQDADGSWRGKEGDVYAPNYAVGVSSLALLALINTGMTESDPEVKRGLTWLRRQNPTLTYEVSLMIQALAAAKAGNLDKDRVTELAQELESAEFRKGSTGGMWSYSSARKTPAGDRSNGQFAVLGLRDAQEMGVPVKFETWRRIRHHWVNSQNRDGSFGYSGGPVHAGGSGSMTVAGIATLVITDTILKSENEKLNADGTPVCCGESRIDKSLEDACRWLGQNFSVRNNPGANSWGMYYLYGLERAGRFSGRRFFADKRGYKHDWYREGAEYLVRQQDPLTGAWQGTGQGDGDQIVSTSFCLMFLSKGMAPVLINKLQYAAQVPANGRAAVNDWNRHNDDVRNLTQLISNLPRWPRLLTWQTVDVAQANIADILQAPILFIGGSEAPQFTPQDVELLKEYIVQGGFILVDNNCRSATFDEAFRDLVRRMYPAGTAPLKRLTGDHPVFRSEYNLLDETTGEPTAELWGVDFGCRTSIMYSPHDLSCLWDKWTAFELPGRPQELSSMITKATRVGVNVVAYVTGRELLDKLRRQIQSPATPEADKIERDLLEISKIRYSGDWDAAPQALRNLLVAFNKMAGLEASTSPRELTLLDPNLFRYPIAYMHGRYEFTLGPPELEKLRTYIKQGGVLFADACCGKSEFDRSFRQLAKQLFPENELKRIPASHEIFTAKIGHDLKSVRRREPDLDDPVQPVAVHAGEPFLEGIEVNGRFVVIYSKYDISCAVHHQAPVPCIGYLYEDAVKIGINVCLYALLQ